jgi:hypothetical protein
LYITILRGNDVRKFEVNYQEQFYVPQWYKTNLKAYKSQQKIIRTEL